MSSGNINVVPVKTRSQLRCFARFNVCLYKGNPYAVPDLIKDTKNSFTPSRNAALEFCQAQPFMALKDGKVVFPNAELYINRIEAEAWKACGHFLFHEKCRRRGIRSIAERMIRAGHVAGPLHCCHQPFIFLLPFLRPFPPLPSRGHLPA